MRISLICFCIGLFGFSILPAQKIIISVTEVKHFDSDFEQNAYKIYDLAVKKIAENKRFTLVERKYFEAIEQEKERQKNEGFIDGVIVEQGKQIGANRVFALEYDQRTKFFKSTLVNIEKGTTDCINSYNVKRFLKGKNLVADFYKTFAKDLERCLSQLVGEHAQIELVEILEKKGDKATKLLFYCEQGCSVQKKDRLKIFYFVQKKVGDKMVNYEEAIGEVEIKEIENESFFNTKVRKGAERIYQIMQEKKQLYAKF